MISRKNTSLAVTLVLLTVFVTGYSNSVASNTTKTTAQVNQKTPAAVYTIEKDNPAASLIKARYVFSKEKKGEYTPVSVYIGENEVLRITQPAGGLNPEKRAKIVTHNLNTLIKNGEKPEDIVPDFIGDSGVIKIKNKVLFTVDSSIAKEYGMTSSELSFLWVNNIRDAFGVARIVRDFELLTSSIKKTPESFVTKYTSYNQTGMASWYGGTFHGQRTADGSRYNKNAFTAAHKSLPFGTVVQVTNLYNGKKCIVKITDRGPFVRGRVIDLSKVAASEIGMVSSGVSRVKVEVLGKV
jgi:rare lipoprotein A